MDTATVKKHDSPPTVNEQVIVMSGHETIRVLEVGVDNPPQPEESGKALDPPVSEPSVTNNLTRETVLCQAENSSAESVVKSSAGLVAPSLPTLFTHAANHPQATLASFALQTAPQVFTQENLATLFTGVMAPTGTVSQPVLIPITIPGQMSGQQGLALWNFPTTTLATIPGLAAAPPAGGMFKLPLANLQAAPVLNTALQTPVQAAPALQAIYQAQPAVQAQAALQATVQPQAALQVPTTLQAQTAMVSSNVVKSDPPTHLTVQPASFTFNPAIISAASIGGQTQLLNSLAAAPIIANAIPGVQGITSQIITNAQGQVIGALPWLLNSPGITAGAATAAVPAPNVLQAVTPQLLLNAQGQIIATLASQAIQPAAIRKQASQDLPAKTEHQPVQQIQPAPTITQPTVVVTNPSPANTSTSSQVHVSCPEPPTVSQLVSKPHSGNYDEDGINLEEIREFAKDFKIRRLSLGLTQTQVGQALTATEGPAYSQSAICRYLGLSSLHFQYRLGISTLSGIGLDTCRALWNVLHQEFIPIPTEDMWMAIADKFWTVCDFPNCLGAVNGKHIRIIKPARTGSEFFNYKKYFSVVLMAIADADCRFIAVDIGAFGRGNDSQTFKNSDMGRHVYGKNFNFPQPRPLPNTQGPPMPFVMVGDEAFQMSENLLKPYSSRYLNRTKRIYNYRLTRARRTVECAFGIMVSKWRILATAINLKMETVDEVVKACVVLHNYILAKERPTIELHEQVANPLPDYRHHPLRSTVEVGHMRDQFAAFFDSEIGRVAWQNNIV
ncbi:POU domain, class 6, transcription factor 1 isoform X1 [Ranitomeya imitator]|uniref:POU domain, class 6, transcription factor 1 isoform X1 n=1 Tax=Ranitomeya imitator TaxID=111125 RepID=UPI0037E737AB